MPKILAGAALLALVLRLDDFCAQNDLVREAPERAVSSCFAREQRIWSGVKRKDFLQDDGDGIGEPCGSPIGFTLPCDSRELPKIPSWPFSLSPWTKTPASR